MTGILRILYTAFTIVFLATRLQANSTIVPVIVDAEASGRGVVEITKLRTQPTLYNIEVLKWAMVKGTYEYKTKDYSSSAHQASNSIPENPRKYVWAFAESVAPHQNKPSVLSSQKFPQR